MRRDFERLVAMRRDLFAAYRDVCSKPCPDQYTAWVRTVKHPAKCFYMHPVKLYEVVKPMLQGDFSKYEKLKNESSKRKFWDLYLVCRRLIELPEYHNATFKVIAQAAVDSPAPEFYITPETFRQAYRYCRRFGVNYYPQKVKRICHQYTNYKDGKAKDAVYDKKLKLFMKL